jgi:hypothetical protein
MMNFLFQVLGVIAAGIAVTALWRRGGAVSPIAAAAMVAIVLASTFLWPGVWRAGDQLNRMRRDAVEATRFEAGLHGGRYLGVNVDFLVWAGERIPANGTFAIVPEAPASIYQWATYQLFPRTYAPEEEADYILFYGVEPSQASWDRAEFGKPLAYGSGMAMVRRSGAG